VHAEKRRGRSRSRILYWFRTPPGVKVGRSALDEDAIRLIEEHNPAVDFDWTRILKGGGEPSEPRKPEPPRRDMRQQAPNQRPPRREPVRESTPPASVPEPGFVEGTGIVAATGSVAENDTIEQSSASVLENVGASVDVVEELTVETAQTATVVPEPEEAPTPAHARLGAEAVIRLRGRYSEILTRISERVQDPARRDELKTGAERLNPDSWVTDAEVQLGLEQYEAVFESLRAVIGRRRRRRRKRGGRPDGSSPQAKPGALPDSEAFTDDDPPEDGDEPGSGEL
jgi:hypothetical protein